MQGQLSLIDIAGTSVSMFLSTWRLNVEVARVCSLYYPEMMACCCELCALWAGAGPPEGVHAGGRWGPMARRRRRFFGVFSFFAIFYLFSWEFGVLAAMLSRLATACRRS